MATLDPNFRDVRAHYDLSDAFVVERVHSLRPHYARTLDCWATNLAARREGEG